MTQADWVKEFDSLYYGSTCGGDGLFNSELFMDIKSFISKVESLAQQRTEKKWREKCNHKWSGIVNKRVPGESRELNVTNYTKLEEYVVCEKCADIKIIRQYEVQTGV